MMRMCVLGAALVVVAGQAAAQQSIDASWVWHDEGNPVESAKPGKVWFRRVAREDGPCTGQIRIACDDQFVLWVNGQRVGEGGGAQGFRFNLNGIVERGSNVIAIEATNAGGRAGLFVDGEIRNQNGQVTPFDTPTEWISTAAAPAGDSWRGEKFEATGWRPVKGLGRHADSPWRAIAFGSTYLDRYQLAPGLAIERIAEPELVGSLVAMTWGPRGRIIASRERGPILAVIDENQDGTFDRVTEYSKEVTNCQGLCMVGDALYAVGNGPQGTGLYRLPDRDQDDRADSAENLLQHRGGIGEHGPHAVVMGPDGWLYHCVGNHAGVPRTPEKESPVRDMYEGDLLQPRFEDARGHAHGIKVPGGAIWRLAPDGSKWWLETAGFRNEYDIAFDWQGELFSFDSDMEWDVGEPWYRPVRVNHCIGGADFGWRSGAAKWPESHFDSLPGTVDIGRGSPTGVIFYEHTALPPRYQGTFLVCDWSMGRIISVRLEPQGASFGGAWENLVTGNPLNVSDIEVDRDGSVVFSTGGRNTEGGIYRVRSLAGEARPQVARTIEEALSAPQIHAAWMREDIAKIKEAMGAGWEAALVEAARKGPAARRIRALTLLAQHGPPPAADLLIEISRAEDAAVRAFVAWLLGYHTEAGVDGALARLLKDPNRRVQRRACDAFVRSGLEPPVYQLLAMLGDSDRWLRYAARLTLERIPSERWRDAVLAASDPRQRVEGLLALWHVRGLDSQATLTQAQAMLRTDLPAAILLDVLRVCQLALLDGQARLALLDGQARLALLDGQARDTGALGTWLLDRFPTGQPQIDREIARILPVLDAGGTAGELVTALESRPQRELQVHYALCLAYVKTGWTFELRRRLLDWYETTRDWEGGHSFVPYLENIVGGSLARFEPEARRRLLEDWRARPFATRLLLSRAEPEQIEGFGRVLETLVSQFEAEPAQGASLIPSAIEALGRSGAPQAQAVLRKLYEGYPDRRDILARALARHPSLENHPYLIRTLQFADGVTSQECLAALRKIKAPLDKPGDVRAVITAGMRLGADGKQAILLLRQKIPGGPGNEEDIKRALAHYQQWFSKTFPHEAPPALPKDDVGKTRYTFDQLVRFLDGDARGQAGDPARGKEVFTKANCLKCHRFLTEGEGIGPDLSTVRRRFQRREIVASLLFPSQVVSDQYRSVNVATSDGRVYTGMPLPQAGSDDKLVLLLSDATKVEIAKADVEVQRPSPTSVMAEGHLKDLSLEQIADLFAFLETSKNNPEPAATAKAPSNSP